MKFRCAESTMRLRSNASQCTCGLAQPCGFLPLPISVFDLDSLHPDCRRGPIPDGIVSPYTISLRTFLLIPI